MENYLLISDAAKEVKVESHVLRYWEEELHLPIKRNELGHRYYTKEDVERFKQIKGMKERGLQLKAIKMILKDGRLDVLSMPPEEPGTQRHTAPRQETFRQDSPRQEAGPQETEQPEISRREVLRQAVPPQMVPGENEGFPESSQEQGNRGELAIDIVSGRGNGREVSQESREDKSRKLQWLLQQLIRQTLQENNGQLCREIRESVVKELDYQFRMQEEREENRDRMLAQRDEEHYKKMDELLRRKSRRLKKEKPEKNRENNKDNGSERKQDKGPEGEPEGESQGINGINGIKKKRFFS